MISWSPGLPDLRINARKSASLVNLDPRTVVIVPLVGDTLDNLNSAGICPRSAGLQSGNVPFAKCL